MSFTIQVEPVDPGREFSIKDLTLHHGECGGGLCSGKEEEEGLFHEWHIKCSRCYAKTRIEVSESGTSAIARTAIDGEQRAVDTCYGCPPAVVVLYQSTK